MITAAVTFIVSWVALLFVSNKKKFPLYVLTGYIGIILALVTDLLTFVYPLWDYPGTGLEVFGTYLFNGFGIYFAVIYFFLQTLPKIQTVLSITRHVFYWSLFAIILELLYLYLGFIEYQLWWNIGFSYMADWILFIFFFFHHKWISNYSLINEH